MKWTEIIFDYQKIKLYMKAYKVQASLSIGDEKYPCQIVFFWNWINIETEKLKFVPVLFSAKCRNMKICGREGCSSSSRFGSRRGRTSRPLVIGWRERETHIKRFIKEHLLQQSKHRRQPEHWTSCPLVFWWRHRNTHIQVWVNVCERRCKGRPSSKIKTYDFCHNLLNTRSLGR